MTFETAVFGQRTVESLVNNAAFSLLVSKFKRMSSVADIEFVAQHARQFMNKKSIIANATYCRSFLNKRHNYHVESFHFCLEALTEVSELDRGPQDRSCSKVS